MDAQPEFVNLRKNIAVDDDGKSFFVLKIKVREKIVADGLTIVLLTQVKPGST